MARASARPDSAKPDQECTDRARDLELLCEAGDEQGDAEHGEEERLVAATGDEPAHPAAVAQRGEQNDR